MHLFHCFSSDMAHPLATDEANSRYFIKKERKKEKTNSKNA